MERVGYFYVGGVAPVLGDSCTNRPSREHIVSNPFSLGSDLQPGHRIDPADLCLVDTQPIDISYLMFDHAGDDTPSSP